MVWRRIFSIFFIYVAFVVIWLALPLLLLCAVIPDLVQPKKRFPRVRFFISLAWILLFEAMGIVLSLYPLLRSKEKQKEANAKIIYFWGRGIFKGIVCIYSLHMEVKGQECVEHGPMILLLRHSSIADVLLANELVAAPNGFTLRYVLKDELRWDPCINIVAPRINCLFVDRKAKNPQEEMEKVGALARNLGPDEGVVVYPEGTRFTAKKRDKILQKLKDKEEDYAYATSLQSLLPPKLGGVLSLLEQNQSADLVFCAHVGFEGMAKISDFWDGSVIGRVIYVEFWRIPLSQIPKDAQARKVWFLKEWKKMDDCVSQYGSR